MSIISPQQAPGIEVPRLDFGGRPVPAPGHMGVDYEARVDFDRLRAYRLDRAKAALEASECGAFLLFDFYNIRYTTQTWIGGALGDKMIRYTLLARGKEPVLWDFGSAVKHHKLYSQWTPEDNYRAGFLGFRGAVAPSVGLMESAIKEIKSLLVEAGVADMPVGVDIVEPPFLFEMERQGLRVVDAQQSMLDARCIKSFDEILLLNQAAAMVDGVYQDITEALKPGVRENEIVAHGQPAALRARLGPGRGRQRDLRGAVQPAPAQLHRPDHPARRPGVLRHHPLLQRLPHLLLPHLRGRQLDAGAARRVHPRPRVDGPWHRRHQGRRRHRRGRRVAPQGREFGFGSEMEAFGLQFAHGLGLGLHERPIISRLNSMKEPVELQVGMVFALETYCPAADGFSAARIEEEIVITEDGPRVLTLFPAQELFVTNPY